MRIEWNKVTWYSKLLALIVFILSGILWFYLGTEYEKTVNLLEMNVREQAAVPRSADNLNIPTQPSSSGTTIAGDNQSGLYDQNQWVLLSKQTIDSSPQLSGVNIFVLRSKDFVGTCGACENPNFYALKVILTKDARILYQFATSTPKVSDFSIAPIYILSDPPKVDIIQKDFTNDGVPEILFYAGFGGASDYIESLHILHYMPSSGTFTDIARNEFSNGGLEKLEFVTIKNTAAILEANGVWADNEGHYSPHVFNYSLYEWDKDAGSFEAISSSTSAQKFDDPDSAIKFWLSEHPEAQISP